MARVAQAGNKDIDVAYNRSLTKTAVPVRISEVRSQEEFELGQEPMKEQTKFILESVVNTSIASCCLANQCAMWRWDSGQHTTGYCGIAGRPEVAT